MSKQTESEQLPPHSPEAETGVLGCVLLDPARAMDLTIEIIGEHANMFYDMRHQAVWASASATCHQ